MKRLEGKRVVLTGAAGGIGSLVAARLDDEGAVVTGIDQIECPSCGSSIVADLSTEIGLFNLSATLAELQIDILINIAGLQYFGPFEEQSPENIWLGFAVNLIAPAVLSRAVLPHMLSRGAGQIVNIGSMLGTVKYPFFATYSSSKAGLQGFSEALRRELRETGIAVTYIAPRAARTKFNNATVVRFMEMTKMKTDEPAFVADKIVRAIISRKAETFIGVQERTFMRLNALVPRLIDAGIAPQVAKARQLFTSPSN